LDTIISITLYFNYADCKGNEKIDKIRPRLLKERREQYNRACADHFDRPRHSCRLLILDTVCRQQHLGHTTSSYRLDQHLVSL